MMRTGVKAGMLPIKDWPFFRLALRLLAQSLEIEIPSYASLAALTRSRCADGKDE